MNNNTIFYQTVVCFALLVVVSCKTTKVTNTNVVGKNTSTKQLVALHKAADFNFETLQSRLKVNFNNGSKVISPSISLRIERDKQIWMSIKVLGLSMGKVYITPNRVSFYVKLKGSYFDGNFKELSQFLGTEVDFDKLQSILIGQSIINLKASKFQSKWKAPNRFELIPKKKDKRYDFIVQIFQKTMKIANYKVEQVDTKKLVLIDYLSYQSVDDQLFPKEVVFNAKKPGKIVNVNLEFKGVQINNPINFPYEIPEGFKKITWP